nr:hypothetical protein [Salmonella enterica]
MVLDEYGNFISGWHLIPGSPQYVNYMNLGAL